MSVKGTKTSVSLFQPKINSEKMAQTSQYQARPEESHVTHSCPPLLSGEGRMRGAGTFQAARQAQALQGVGGGGQEHEGRCPGTRTGLSRCLRVLGRASDTSIWRQEAQGLAAGRTSVSPCCMLHPELRVRRGCQACSCTQVSGLLVGSRLQQAHPECTLPPALSLTGLPPPSANAGTGLRRGPFPQSSRSLNDPGPCTLTGSWG